MKQKQKLRLRMKINKTMKKKIAITGQSKLIIEDETQFTTLLSNQFSFTLLHACKMKQVHRKGTIDKANLLTFSLMKSTKRPNNLTQTLS
jgi:hypothetical protein